LIRVGECLDWTIATTRSTTLMAESFRSYINQDGPLLSDLPAFCFDHLILFLPCSLVCVSPRKGSMYTCCLSLSCYTYQHSSPCFGVRRLTLSIRPSVHSESIIPLGYSIVRRKGFSEATHQESENGFLLLLTADNEKTTNLPSSSREVLPHSSWICWPTELKPDKPTDRPNKGTIMQGRDVCAVRSSTPDIGYLEWQLALLCRSRRESIGMEACPSTYYPIDASGHRSLALGR
jgi:hypothetical protein